MRRKDFLKSSSLMIAGGMAFGFHPVATAGERARVADGPASFPIYDLHVHTSGRQNPQKILEKAREHNIQMFGIVDNVASTYGIQNDEELLYFINALKELPCYIGLQPMEIGWSKRFTRELLDKIDYVIMDPQTVPDSNRYGDTAEVWEHDCYIPDAEEFMEVNMRYYMKVINNPEPLDIFGWPLFLPPAIARDYHRLWTRERQEMVIEAVRQRGIAIEINDLARTPHAEFILKAKQAGVKFTFGSDTRDHRTFRLDYCKQIASLCGLTEADFYIPERKAR